MNITRAQLLEALPASAPRVDRFLAPLNAAMVEFQINTPARVAAFIAQIGHESGSFYYMREIASGEAYEGRVDLGNTEPGDGRRYRGRGPIQITGRANVLACSLALFKDDRLLHFPEVLEDPAIGCRAAGWFWQTHGLNELADVGNFRRITKIINGGYTHYDERVELHRRALIACGVAAFTEGVGNV